MRVFGFVGLLLMSPVFALSTAHAADFPPIDGSVTPADVPICRDLATSKISLKEAQTKFNAAGADHENQRQLFAEKFATLNAQYQDHKISRADVLKAQEQLKPQIQAFAKTESQILLEVTCLGALVEAVNNNKPTQ